MKGENEKFITAIKLCAAYLLNIVSMYVIIRVAVPFIASGGVTIFGTTVNTVTISIVVLATYSYSLMLIFYKITAHKTDNKELKLTNHIIESLVCGMLRVEIKDNMQILHASTGFKEMMGYSGDSDNDGIEYLADYIAKDELSKLNRLAVDCYKNGEHTLNTICNATMRDSYGINYEGSIKIIGNVDKKAGKMILDCVVIDMSKEIALSNELSNEKERYRLISEYSDDIILEVTSHGLVVYVSSNFSRIFGSIGYNEPIMYGFSERGSIKKDDTVLIGGAVRRILDGDIQNWEAELELKEASDEWHWYRVTIMKFVDKSTKADRIMCKLTRIDKEVQSKNKLIEKANKDALTELLNKEAFSMEVEQRIHTGCTRGTMIFFDIDNFKGLNDSLGHLIGDNALKDVAECMRRNTRENDILSRFGGDEYCIFLCGTGLAESKQIIERIRGNVIKQYNNGDKSFEVTISIGAVGYPESGNNVRLLLQKADQALYKAKKSGKNQAWFM